MVHLKRESIESAKGRRVGVVLEKSELAERVVFAGERLLFFLARVMPRSGRSGGQGVRGDCACWYMLLQISPKIHG